MSLSPYDRDRIDSLVELTEGQFTAITARLDAISQKLAVIDRIVTLAKTLNDALTIALDPAYTGDPQPMASEQFHSQKIIAEYADRKAKAAKEPFCKRPPVVLSGKYNWTTDSTSFVTSTEHE